MPILSSNYDPSRPVTYYLHITKTGGNSFRRLAYYNTPDEHFVDNLVVGRIDDQGEVVTSRSLRREVTELADRVASGAVRFICSNVPYGLHDRVGIPFNYLTTVRHPVSRAQSYWRFVYSNRDGAPYWRQWEALGLDIEAILDDESGLPMSNDQTRIIGNSAVRHQGPAEVENATAHLRRHFFFIGDFEQYEGEVTRLAEFLDWEYRQIPRVNVATSDSANSLPPQFDEVVRAANDADVELYRRVQELS